MRCLIFGVVLAACGSSTPPGGGPVGNAAPDAGPRQLAPHDSSCPEGYPPEGGACDPTVASRTCQYDEGSCYCGVEPICSGAVMHPDEIAQMPKSWQCTPWPPTVRADGCPGQPGGACSNETFDCQYGDCCVSTYRCFQGEWQQVNSICPP